MSTQQNTTAVATQSDKPRDLKTILNGPKMREQFAAALPRHLSADRFCRIATTALMRVPNLALCTQDSFMKCLLDLSAWGIEPDGRRAHLIPFKNNRAGTYECTLILDWKGLAELALRSGMIAKLHADLICDKDVFDFDMGEILHHKINYREPRGEPYAAYAMAETKDGAKFVQVMTKDEIEKIRNNSQGYKAAIQYNKDSPWTSSPGEMWKKTVFRRLAKWLPLSAEFRDAIDKEDTYDEPPVREVGPETTRPKIMGSKTAADVAAEEFTPQPPTDDEQSGAQSEEQTGPGDTGGDPQVKTYTEQERQAMLDEIVATRPNSESMADFKKRLGALVGVDLPTVLNKAPAELLVRIRAKLIESGELKEKAAE